MSMNNGYFTLPSSLISKEIEGDDTKVIVISVFGQSTLDMYGYKSSPFEKLFGKNVFLRNMTKQITLNEEFCGLEGYYDAKRQIVFLHLAGALDSSLLNKSLQILNAELQEKGFLVVWSDLRFQYARRLLLLFTVSHLLLLFHPNHVFDVSYIHLFRTMDAIRLKFQHCASDILTGVPGVSKDWQMNGRLSSPRVLFVFSSHLIPLHVLKEASANNKATNKASSTSPLRKLELDLEYQIYRLLRKSRVITNISANSLFALPNNQPFVYVMEDALDHRHPSALITDTLNNICSASSNFPKFRLDLSHEGLDSAVSKGVGALSESFVEELQMSSRDKGDTLNFLSESSDADVLSDKLLSSVSKEKKRNLEHSFSVFLLQHVEEALTRGFVDSVGRHATQHFFEVPPVNVWFEAFQKLHDFYASKEGESEAADEYASDLKNTLQTEIRYSDARCGKVLPLAVSAYTEGLPTHYTKARHQTKLDVAMGILAGQAKGPMLDSYVKELEKTCEMIWKTGRVGCETLSFTGNTCFHPKHVEVKDSESTLPVLSHSSNVAFITYCNCGRHQGKMDDPFTIKAANYDFYEKMTASFCCVADAYPFPSFQSSVDDARAADVSVDSDKSWSGQEGGSKPLRMGRTAETASPPSSLGMSLSSQGLSQGEHRVPEEVDGEEAEIFVTVKDDDHSGSSEPETTTEVGLGASLVDRQSSTTEYLPGMLTTSSPQGLLPQFPSWSLVCLGPSSLYSHNSGVCDQPGFLPGTNFLLPWDVNIKIKDKDKWPAITDSMGKKGFLLKNKKTRMGCDLTQFSVKIFLGTEYQCSRGHRFMMASPDRPLKASPMGLVKDTAIKIANTDMPLYFPCPCSRRGAFTLGQLMRIHIVTPKAPVHVTLNAQVQISVESLPKFVPQPPSFPLMKLSASAYWVLRLPFSYAAESGPIYPPNPYQVDVTSHGKLLKGCYGISEIDLDG